MSCCSLVHQGESKFDFVPKDGHLNINRTEAGMLALGDLSLRIRPAGVQHKTIPPVPVLAPYPAYTALYSGFGDPGTAEATGRLVTSCAQT